MIRTKSEFLDATAFEDAAVSTILPLVAGRDRQASLDLRTKKIVIQVNSAVLGEHGRASLIRALRPLFFGAAWKTLDLMIEYGLNCLVVPQEWTIAEKCARAPTARVVPLDTDPDVWRRLAELYRETVETRHCLIHRRFDLADGGHMTNLRDRQGRAVRDFTVADQDAFCRAVQRARIAVVNGKFSTRDRLDMVASLDALGLHHGQPPIGGGAIAVLPELIKVEAVRTSDGWYVDTETAVTAAATTFPGRTYYDVEISFPETGFPPMRGQLESAPRGPRIAVDPSSPPTWIGA
jgi:hypothetical protein